MPRTDILERKEEILQWIEEERTKAYMCQQLQCKQATLNSYLEKMGIKYAGQQAKKGQHKGGIKYIPAEYYFDNQHPIASSRLREKLFRDGLKERRCEKCGVSVWNGVDLPLELHHKNGNHLDNSFENLEILCPNCHSIQPGNSGANIGKYGSVPEQAQGVVLETTEHSQCEFDSRHSHQYHCTKCGKQLNRQSKSGLCRECWSLTQRRVDRPNREELKGLIRTTSFLQIAKHYGVSDNAVRKWCKMENLPHKTSEIKKYSNEEWEQL